MFEVEIYARGLREMGKILELNRHLVEIAGLRYKVDTNHDIVYVEFDEPTLSVREILRDFPQPRPSTAFYRRDSDGASVANKDGAAECGKCADGDQNREAIRVRGTPLTDH